jgi:hypothetical protein
MTRRDEGEEIDDLGVRPSTSPSSVFDRERRRGTAVDESGCLDLAVVSGREGGGDKTERDGRCGEESESGEEV